MIVAFPCIVLWSTGIRLLFLKYMKGKVLLAWVCPPCAARCWPCVLVMTQCVKWPQVMKVQKRKKKKNYFSRCLTEHQNARCHFELLGLWSRRMFELTCCRWRFSVCVRVRCHYVSFFFIELGFIYNQEVWQTTCVEKWLNIEQSRGSDNYSVRSFKQD